MIDEAMSKAGRKGIVTIEEEKSAKINIMYVPLTKMSIEIPYCVAICARQRLLRTQTLFTEDIKILVFHHVVMALQ
nr:nucleolar protein 14 [Tanacetum cinerariifolium]